MNLKLDKSEIFKKLIESVKSELLILKQAAKDTADYATDSENKPENKYDTRGLEASYLAGAQALRVAEMQDVLMCFETYALKIFQNQKPSQKISLGSLVEVFSVNKAQFLLILPLGGGQTLQYDQKSIQVITPQSPLGKALIGQVIDESVTIIAGDSKREYEIVSIL